MTCDLLCTVLDNHAHPSLRIVVDHNSSPWFESIRDKLLIAKRERRQAERRRRNTKLTIFKDLYRQAKHKVSNLVHTAKCKCNKHKTDYPRCKLVNVASVISALPSAPPSHGDTVPTGTETAPHGPPGSSRKLAEQEKKEEANRPHTQCHRHTQN